MEIVEFVGEQLNIDTTFGQQNEEEFVWLLDNYVKGVASILEVGSSFGHSLRMMAHASQPGARIRSVDLGFDYFQEGKQAVRRYSVEALRSLIGDLSTAGYDTDVFIGDSHSPEAVAWAAQWAPYDFIFIDGDHDYEGVRADWLNYGPLGRTVAFHDIDVMAAVSKFWMELKASGVNTDECIRYESKWHRRLGIGVVRR